MTSKLTRERVVALIAEHSYDSALVDALEHLLAAMDSEPVAEVVSIYGDPEAFGEREIRPLIGIQQMPYGTKLYRHAQPAPVVPGEATPDSIEILASARRRDHAVFQWDEDQRNAAADSWNACRASMLQELKKSAGTEATCRSNENVQVLHTKSPAQSDCCPAQNHVSPEQNGDTPAQSQGWIPVSERMPEPGILVLVYTPPQPGDYPGDVRIGFDYIDPDGDDPTYWFNHGENYEHFCCVACDGMAGPSEKALYTHWMPLPAAPQEVR